MSATGRPAAGSFERGFRGVATIIGRSAWVALLVHLAPGTSGALAAQADSLARWGDSSIVATADVRAIYEAAGTRVYALIGGNALALPDGGPGEIIEGKLVAGQVARIVAGAWTTTGKYVIELYFRRDSPVFVFEAFYYLPEAAPVGQWRNWQALPAWERRSYWRGDTVVYVESRGRAAEVDAAERAAIGRRAMALRQVVAARARELGSAAIHR